MKNKRQRVGSHSNQERQYLIIVEWSFEGKNLMMQFANFKSSHKEIFCKIPDLTYVH